MVIVVGVHEMIILEMRFEGSEVVGNEPIEWQMLWADGLVKTIAREYSSSGSEVKRLEVMVRNGLEKLKCPIGV